jgi:hypothetical protein
MTLGTILLIVLVLLLIGAFPSWGHSRSWGYGPNGFVGVAFVVVVVLLATGRLQSPWVGNLGARAKKRCAAETVCG